VSLFVLSPEIEDRDEVKVGNWAKHKKTFYSEWYILFYLQADHKKIGHKLICFFPAVTIFKPKLSDVLSANFQIKHSQNGE
jgi:hypothetical protein